MAMPARQLAPIRGAMIGAAVDIDEAIEAAAVSKLLRHVLNKAKREAFSTAGYQQHGRGRPAAEPGLWCEFDLAEWARDLARFGITRKYLWRLREQAEALGFFTYHTDDEDPGRAYLRWNLDLGTWAALDPEYGRRRYHRDGAGRKSANQSNVIRSLADETESKVAESESKVIRLPAKRRIKSDTLARYEAASQAAPAPPLRIHTEETEPSPSTASAHAHARPAAEPERPPEAVAMAGASRSYDFVTPKRPRRFADLPPKLAADVQPILDILQDAPGWKPDARDEALVIEVAEIRPLEWLRQQALRFAATREQRDGRPMRHTMREFMGWCTGPQADRMVAEWEERRREIAEGQVSKKTAEGARPNEHPRRPGAAGKPAQAKAPAPGPGGKVTRRPVSNGIHSDKRPLWIQD
jgi:hypothetical protein